MTDLELAELLSRTVENAPYGQKTNAYVMFRHQVCRRVGKQN